MQNKIRIISKGTVCDTKVKLNGKVVRCCNILRYKYCPEEQALTILYFKNHKGKVQYDKDGQVIEKQYLFRDTNSDFYFDITNQSGEVRLKVSKGKAKVYCGGVWIKSVKRVLWQLECLSDLHEFEMCIF
jgi:hypothetical protein